MDAADLELRNATYRLFVQGGRAPTAAETAKAAGIDVPSVHAGWRQLHDAHALVLSTSAMELRMANPFSAVPTAHRVHAAGRWWYANCAWDAFGIPAALKQDAAVDARCAWSGERIVCGVQHGAAYGEGVIHLLVPAAHFWDDIGYT